MAGRAKSNFCCRVLVCVSAHKVAGEHEESITPGWLTGRANLKAALLTSLQPADRNRPLLFFPPERIGFHDAGLRFPLVKVRESFRPPGEGQLPGGTARPPASIARLPAPQAALTYTRAARSAVFK